MQEWINKTLGKLKIQKLNEIQEQAIPLIFKNQNLIGIAPTGSGKTLAFLIPILEKLVFNNGYQAIVLVPTRELARQIHSVLVEFKHFQPQLKVHLWIGGNDFEKQVQQATSDGQMIIATPKRFLEVIRRTNVDFRNLQTIVLDETDMLFDLGFFPEVEQIFQLFRGLTVQKLAFTATLHDLLANNLRKYFTNTKIVKVKSLNQNITHNIVWNKDKFHSLSVILNQINPYLCLIFANTKKQVDAIYRFLKEQGRNVVKLHSDLQTRERKNNYQEIKKLKYQYVVASDLASRGLDIDGASHVISWDLPTEAEWYFHRAGRTGRQKYSGTSYVLFDPNESQVILKKLVEQKITFHDYTIKNNQLVQGKSRIQRSRITPEQKAEIQTLLSKPRTVKPGYKKKLNAEIKKINQKHKHAHLEKVIKQKRIEKYKK